MTHFLVGGITEFYVFFEIKVKSRIEPVETAFFILFNALYI